VTGPCSVCGMRFQLVLGNMVRLHNNMRGSLCPGSLRPQAEEKVYFGWRGTKSW
jgi:hypothetical protein